MTNKEWAIAVLYTLSTATEALFVTGVCVAESDIAIIWLMLAVVWGIVILASLFKGGADNDDIQEY